MEGVECGNVVGEGFAFFVSYDVADFDEELEVVGGGGVDVVGHLLYGGESAFLVGGLREYVRHLLDEGCRVLAEVVVLPGACGDGGREEQGEGGEQGECEGVGFHGCVGFGVKVGNFGEKKECVGERGAWGEVRLGVGVRLRR